MECKGSFLKSLVVFSDGVLNGGPLCFDYVVSLNDTAWFVVCSDTSHLEDKLAVESDQKWPDHRNMAVWKSIPQVNSGVVTFKRLDCHQSVVTTSENVHKLAVDTDSVRRPRGYHVGHLAHAALQRVVNVELR